MANRSPLKYWKYLLLIAGEGSGLAFHMNQYSYGYLPIFIFFIILGFIWITCAAFLYSYVASRISGQNMNDVLKKDIISYSPLLLLFLGSELSLVLRVFSFTLAIALVGLLKFLFLDDKLLNLLPLDLIEKRGDKIIFLLIFLYFSMFSVIAIEKHYSFSSSAYDLGIFDQELWGYTYGGFSFNTVRGLSLQADHFSPIAFLFVPFYYLFPSPSILLVIQAALIGVGALPLYWLARDKAHNRFLALSLTLAYLLFPAIWYMNGFDFHYTSLLLPFALFAFYFLQKERWVLFFIFVSLMLITYEIAAITVFLLGLYMILFSRKVKFGLLTSAIGVIWYFLAIRYVMPTIGDGITYQYFTLYSHYGSNIFELSKNIILNFPLTINEIYRSVSYFVMLFISTGFIALLAWEVLLIAAPAFLINILSSRGAMSSIYYQYNYFTAAFILIASVFGAVHLCSFIKSIKPELSRNKIYAAIAVFILLSGYLSNAALTDKNIFRYSHNDVHSVSGRQIISAIPPGASMSASNNLVPHLTHRKEVFMYPVPFAVPDFGNFTWWGPNNKSFDEPLYVLLDLNQSKSGTNQISNYYINYILNNTNYSAILYDGDYILFEKTYAGCISDAVFYMVAANYTHLNISKPLPSLACSYKSRP